MVLVFWCAQNSQSNCLIISFSGVNKFLNAFFAEFVLHWTSFLVITMSVVYPLVDILPRMKQQTVGKQYHTTDNSVMNVRFYMN